MRMISSLKSTRRKMCLSKGMQRSIFVLVLLLFMSCSSMPSDSQVKALFTAHEAEFIQLRDMLLSEPIIKSIGEDEVGDFSLFEGKWRKSGMECTFEDMLRETGLSVARYQHYISLLQSIKTAKIFKQTGESGNAVFFQVACPGLLYDSPEGCKFIRFDTEQLEPVVDDTDASEVQKKYGKEFRYSKIKDQWYIHRSW